MNILVINAGSSSIKYQLLAIDSDERLCQGIMERIGTTDAHLHHQWRDPQGKQQTLRQTTAITNHHQALERISHLLQDNSSINDLQEIAAIGHRVVHGGERFRQPVLIDHQVISAIRALEPLAPLHNPANLIGIEVCLQLFPGLPQAAVFDTAFHQSMPPQAYRYALPESLYLRHHVRRYGFHGTSHQYVAQQAAAWLKRPLSELRLISLHLGNGASAAAIEGGCCIDTSMGLTPLEGLMMGTRCGDLDPAILFYLLRTTGMSPVELEALLNRESGLKGICSVSDMRDVLSLADDGDVQARLALSMFCYRIRKYIGAYFAALGGADAVIFTAGIGENAPRVRQLCCQNLAPLGISIDEEKNRAQPPGIFAIHQDDAAIRLLVIPTDEELAIARQVRSLINNRFSDHLV